MSPPAVSRHLSVLQQAGLLSAERQGQRVLYRLHRDALLDALARFAFVGMTGKGHASIDDILLLFIYLELGAMVGIYFKTNHMPVRFLIYVAITALTRMLIANIQHNHTPNMGILLISGGILLLAFATLVIRYGSAKYPSAESVGK